MADTPTTRKVLPIIENIKHFGNRQHCQAIFLERNKKMLDEGCKTNLSNHTKLF